MTTTYYGVDNEFGTATGSNVGTTSNSSTFDNPPEGSVNLVITSNADDDDPLVFEIGDTYDVSWGGQGGGGNLQDAVVVRSDAAPGQGGIVVFEGVDENGDIAQVIWTPGFDLNSWYDDNYNSSMEPQFYTEDTDASYTHRYVCFVSGTFIETTCGPKPVETLCPGDQVLTLDAGPQPVVWAGHRDCRGYGEQAPITFETGSLGNTCDLSVSPQHRILMRSGVLDLHYSSSEMLAAAKAFLGVPRVHRTPRAIVRYCHFLLPAHHLIWANGALCESLHTGDDVTALHAGDPSFASALEHVGADARTQSTARPVLRTRHAARFLRTHAGCLAALQPTCPDGTAPEFVRAA